MYHYVAQVGTLISALVLTINAQTFYDQHHHSSHLGSPDVKIIKVEQPTVDGGAHRELVVLGGQHPYQGHQLTPHLEALEKAAAHHYGSAYPHYPQYASGYSREHYAPHAPKYEYGKQEQPYLVAVEDVRPPTLHSPGKHVSVYDVNVPAHGPHLYHMYLKGLHESEASFLKPLKDELRPDIDVRSLNPVRALRGADDPKIVFPQESEDTDDSVEILAPMRETREAQIGKFYQDPVVNQLYRYAEQPIPTYQQHSSYESY